MKRIFAIGALTSLGSCIGATWRRDVALEPVQAARIASLQPGASDLGACLDALGAPLYVWEYRGDGLALGYGWLDSKHWGAGARAEVARGMSASFNYDSIHAATQGCVLFFDDAWMLKSVTHGSLRDIAAGLERQRPAPVED